MTSPKSSGSATPPPPTLASEVPPAQTEHVDSIVDRMIGQGEILVDKDGSIWAGPVRPPKVSEDNPVDPASSSTDPIPHPIPPAVGPDMGTMAHPTPPTRRITRRDWGAIMVIEDAEEPSDMQIHDQTVAEAVFTLYLEGYDFDVQQLSPEQLQLYHEMVGQYMCSLHEVD